MHVIRLSQHLLLMLVITSTALGRLGETPTQCAQRYGPAKTDPVTLTRQKTQPVMEGAILQTFEYGGWELRVAFLAPDGPAVRIRYIKTSAFGPDPLIKDYEIDAILKGNAPQGSTWASAAVTNPRSPNKGLAQLFEGMIAGSIGARAWKRSDGALAQLQPGKLYFDLEFPAAREFEERLKIMKEQQTRAAVPKF